MSDSKTVFSITFCIPVPEQVCFRITRKKIVETQYEGFREKVDERIDLE
jgi:hypothetical protein